MPDRADANPDAMQEAAEPAVGHVEVGGTEIYYELRGAGEPVLLVGAADEDAEIYRGVAERSPTSAPS